MGECSQSWGSGPCWETKKGCRGFGICSEGQNISIFFFYTLRGDFGYVTCWRSVNTELLE